MFLETLKTLVLAGRQALQDSLGLQVMGAAVSQLHHGRLSFPAVAEIKVRNGTLQAVYLGCDPALTETLTAASDAGRPRPGVESLGKSFVDNLVREMAGRNPRGSIERIRSGKASITARGVRSYGVRLATDRGQLFMLAEIPSKVELEQAKGSEYLQGMVETYLPRDWMQRDVLENKGLVHSLRNLLLKIEADYHVEIPVGEGEALVHSGIALEERVLEGRPVLKLALSVTDAAHSLRPGTVVHAAVGLEDRSLECDLEYLGPATHPVACGISLDCALFAAPERFDLVQRRRAFRIPIPDGVQVEMLVLDDETPAYCAFLEAPPERIERFTLTDLSFSGARLGRASESAPEMISEGRRAVCRMIFPDEFEPLDLLVIVRRCSKRLANRNEWQLDVGVEFLVSPDLDRRSLEFVRQYVLAEQRAKLARRVAVRRPSRVPVA